jgi:YVTN family beta-propeller protein
VTHTTAWIAAGTTPNAVAVNPATNKIYVPNYVSANVTVIDGATNTTTTVAAGSGPASVAVNPVTNKIYVANYDSNDVTVLTEQEVAAIPLTTTISPLVGDVTSSATPTFTLDANSTFAPIAPPVQGVFTQVDTWQGSWQAATLWFQPYPFPPIYTATTSPLGLGTHVLYAYAVDGQHGAVSSFSGQGLSPLVGSIAAYVFTVVPVGDTMPFLDGFESGNTTNWSATVP